jgi:hypothetical protein
VIDAVSRRPGPRGVGGLPAVGDGGASGRQGHAHDVAAEPMRCITVVPEQPYAEAYGQRRALTPGTLLEADVVQDTRAIWEWMFEPLLAARQKTNVLSGDRE